MFSRSKNIHFFLIITKNSYTRVYKFNSRVTKLPGHFCVLHFLFSKSGPKLEQSLPPSCGSGLVQVRVRVCSPPPQVSVQSDQFVNGE